MNAQHGRPILIAGGGIGGFATALALSQRGFRVHLLEQASEFTEIGAGIQLGPNVFEMFDILGISEQMKARAAFPENLVMMDGISGEEVGKIPLQGEFLARFRHPYALIHRADAHDVLVRACREQPLITMSTGEKVVAFEDHGDSVTVRTASGKEIGGVALIGADGVWSSIRNQVIGDGAPRVSGHIAYRAVLPIDQVPEHLRPNNMTLWAGEKTHLVHYPLRGGKLFNLVAVFHSNRYEEGWDTFGDPEELRLRFQNATGTVLTMLEKIESWRMWVLCDRDPAKGWSKGRVTLIGDAAHPMLQYMAQGACMAVEDAVVLAGELASTPDDVTGALQGYCDARYLRTGRVQLSARLYGEVYHASGVTRELRNAFVRSKSLENHLDGMAWLYDGIATRHLTRAAAA